MIGFIMTMVREFAIIAALVVGILWGVAVLWEGWVTRPDED